MKKIMSLSSFFKRIFPSHSREEYHSAQCTLWGTASLLCALLFSGCASTSPFQYLLIGSAATDGASGALRLYTFDAASGEIQSVCENTQVNNPTFFCLSADHRRLYSVGEEPQEKTPSANLLALDAEAGTISLLQSQPTRGASPCFITFTPDSSAIITANYMGGSISRFPLSADGRLGDVEVTAFQGHGLIPDRQEQSHPHAVYFTPSGQVLVNDLGCDCTRFAPVNYEASLTGEGWKALQYKPGTGPRHLCWDADRSHAYLVSEISDEVFTLVPSADTLRVVQTLHADSLSATGSADIHLTADGRFLYASHRLAGDGISIFRVGSDGLLTRIGYQPCGRHPRNFLITPDDAYLLVACRDDNRVEVFRRDMKTGYLTPTGQTISVPAPVCVKIF